MGWDVPVRRAKDAWYDEPGFLDAHVARIREALAKLPDPDPAKTVILYSAHSLPVATGAFAVVVLRAGDGEGPFADPAAARREAERATAPGGVLLVERAGGFDAVPAASRGAGAA